MSDNARGRASRSTASRATALVEPRLPLADFLRDELDLTGTHVGCEHGVCGNCNVLARRRDRPLVPASSPCRPTAARSRPSRASPRPTARSAAAAGVPGQPRAPVRLLHAGDAADRARVPARAPGRRHRRGDPGGDQRHPLPLHRLPAHRRGDPRRGRKERHEHAEQDPNAAKVARDTGGADEPRAGSARASTASRTRASSAARAATSTTSSCPGMLHAAVVRSPHAHARIVSIDTSKAEALPGVVRVVTGRTRRSTRPAAGLRRRADRPGHDRDREGPLRRRDRRGRDRREPLRRRGRLRAGRGRLRAAAGRARPRGGPRGRAPRSSTRRSARTSPTSARSPSARSTGRSPTPTARSRRELRWPRSTRPCRWTPSARSATTTPARAS